jgi:glutamate-1-semialdehyde 2,1-aminomutase
VSTRSEELFEQAMRLLPGGVNSPVRAYRAVGGAPRFIARGEGPYVWDVDGRRYVDLVCSWGPLILGHRHPAVEAALERQLRKGWTFGAPTEGEVELARVVQERMPGVEMLRLVNSGTEAVMSAVRLARAVTGRRKLIKFAGGYHGHADPVLVDAGSGMATLGIPGTPGITPGAAEDTVVVRYNDVVEVETAFDRWSGQVAALIVEPVAGNMGVVPPRPGFLQGLRRLTEREGALLIFDEVITGFRVARGGAQELYGVRPDLTCLGKVLGGGLPIGGYGGRRDLMERIAPAGDVYQAGTLSGNPLAVAAGIAALGMLGEEAYLALSETTLALAAGLREAAGSRPVQVAHTTGLLTVFFSARPVRSYADARDSDLERHAAFCRALLERGVYPPASQFEAWFPSLAHTAEHIERTVEAAREAFALVA